MGWILPTILDTKYKSILSRERSLAKAVASAVIDTPSISVWEIMIPILFLFNFLRFKRARETFSLNFLFTKRLALDAALEMVGKGKTKEEAKFQIRAKTGNILAADKKGIYSSKIRQRQMNEIELLMDHYCRMLKAEGKDYLAMVKNAYQNSGEYAAFLKELERAEKAVNQAAMQVVRTHSAEEIVSRMEEVPEKIRMAEIENIFG
jgi:hypothetical protein